MFNVAQKRLQWPTYHPLRARSRSTMLICYTACAYSNNFSKGVDLDLLTVQGYMKDTPRHCRHVHCTACWTHPVKLWTFNARYNYTMRRHLISGEVGELNPRLMQTNDRATNHWTKCVVMIYCCLNSILQCFTKVNQIFF